MIDVAAAILADAQARTSPRAGETPAEFAERVTSIARSMVGVAIVRHLRSCGLGVVAVDDRTLRRLRARGMEFVDTDPATTTTEIIA